MKALESVWVYVDPLAPAGDALAAAVEVCRRSGAALTLVGAIGRSQDHVFQTSAGAQVLQAVRKDREAWVLGLADNARRTLAADRVRSLVLEGEVPWHSVAAHAGVHRPDLLVLAARGGTQSGFDSVSQHLFRKCAAPVWSVYPGQPPFPRLALAAVDPGEAGSEKRLLARRVLMVAAQIAGGGPLELHVAHAWRLHGEELFRRELGDASTRVVMDSVREDARRGMEELLAEADFATVAEVHLPNGDPAPAIPAVAEQLGADLVLLGNAVRTGLAGFLIGGTAEAIIARLTRSVLVVKPTGFVSPVRPSRGERAITVGTPE